MSLRSCSVYPRISIAGHPVGREEVPQ